ncbi:MAG: LysE family transporter [Alphaproteobacteria bacterium]|jgi:threonine/homoserine/homoserine lactone efflux protein|nr:LysE family transporter [Alphaproteobacteria bacterium]
MSLDLWIAFALASAVVLAIPGPTILLVVSYALGQGRRSAMATVAGVALGDLTAMTASMLGVGALLAASAELFTLLKWLGAAYLVWLGAKLWRAPVATGPVAADAPPPAVPARRMVGHAFLVTALNPKSLTFFVAFLPQFVDPARPFLVQMIVLEATFVTLAAINAMAYALVAARARGAVRRPAVQRAVNRLGGSLLIGAGVATVVWRRG